MFKKMALDEAHKKEVTGLQETGHTVEATAGGCKGH
jgi:hypothetical protein